MWSSQNQPMSRASLVCCTLQATYLLVLVLVPTALASNHIGSGKALLACGVPGDRSCFLVTWEVSE